MIESSSIDKARSELFGSISACRTIAEKQAKTAIDPYMEAYGAAKNVVESAIDDPTQLLVDLYNALGIGEKLKDNISEIITTSLPAIERGFKEILKVYLKQFVSCSTNPSVVKELFQSLGGSGINLPIDDIDPMKVLAIDPGEEGGDLNYFDISEDSSLYYKSSDFNVFLYYILTNEVNLSKKGKWGKTNQKVWSNDILNTKFTEGAIEIEGEGVVSNYFTVYADDAYLQNTKIKLDNFNNDYIDSLKLFDSKTLISSILDAVFGFLTLRKKKSIEQAALENEIEEILDRLSNSDDEEDVIDDSYFAFTNEDRERLISDANKRIKGVYEYKTNSVSGIGLSMETVMDVLSDVGKGSMVEDKTIISNAIDSITDELISSNSAIDKNDGASFKRNIIEQLIRELVKRIVMSIVSPKIMFIIVLNFKMMGIATSTDPLTVIKDNRKFIQMVAKKVKEQIIDMLMKDVIQKATELAQDMLSQMLQEQGERLSKYMKSLTGF